MRTADAGDSIRDQSRPRDRWYCLCGCGVCLRGYRAHAMYASNACKRRYYRRQAGIQPRRRPLQPGQVG